MEERPNCDQTRCGRLLRPIGVIVGGGRYGVRFREGQGADHFVALAEKAGFQVVSRGNGDGWFFLEMAKVR